MAQDFMGNELKIGDIVVFQELNYRNFAVGKIKEITNKTVLLDWWSDLNDLELGIPRKSNVRQLHSQVVKQFLF